MPTISPSALQRHIDDNDGYCLRCNRFTRDGGTEPDAEGYPCPVCGQKKVVGAEQAVLLGVFEEID